MILDHAVAQDLLEAYARAWASFDGDAWVALFTEDAVYREEPLELTLAGHLELRSYLLDASRSTEQVEFVVERHWVVPPTILAIWHAGFVRRATHERVRCSGVLVLETAADGRIARLREWWNVRGAPPTTGA